MMYNKPEFKIERFDIEEKIMADDSTSIPDTNVDDSNGNLADIEIDVVRNVFNF